MANVMRLVVSGGRNGYSQREIDATLDEWFAKHPALTLIEGCAPGVDRQVEDWARRHRAIERKGRDVLGLKPIERLVLEHWPALWHQHGGCWCRHNAPRCNFAGHRRNVEMADSQIDHVLAIHPNLYASKGTRNMAAQARRRQIPVDTLGTSVPDWQLDRWAAELEQERSVR